MKDGKEREREKGETGQSALLQTHTFREVDSKLFAIRRGEKTKEGKGKKVEKSKPNRWRGGRETEEN